MYFLYVDESGDIGMTNSPTDYFILSGLVIHELRWNETLERIIEFRRDLNDRFGLKLREEIHAGHFIHKPGELQRTKKYKRVIILRETIDFISSIQDLSIINIVIEKSEKSSGFDAFETAWKYLIQRFHNTLSRRNFPGPQNPEDKGTMFVDRTNEKKLRNLTRKMRRHNPVSHKGQSGYRQVHITEIIEDPVHRDSLHSYFIQLADVVAYFLLQKHDACGYIKKKGGVSYFDRLKPVLCRVASSSNDQGIVYV